MAFRFLTAGESHGPELGVIVEGMPAGVPLTEAALEIDMRRRQGGYGRGARTCCDVCGPVRVCPASR